MHAEASYPEAAVIAMTLLTAILGVRIAWNARHLPGMSIGLVLRSLGALVIFLVYAIIGAVLAFAFAIQSNDPLVH
ncbi:MAG: hypothetical protein R3D33_10240 [Hyphomicrobiaceae bacterium]